MISNETKPCTMRRGQPKSVYYIPNIRKRFPKKKVCVLLCVYVCVTLIYYDLRTKFRPILLSVLKISPFFLQRKRKKGL